MTTRLVSIKEFRDNMTKFLREAQKKNVHFVIMRHAEPVARITPLTKKQMALEELEREMDEAMEDVRNGKFYTTGDVRKMLGL